MLNLPRIARLAEAAEFERLLEEVLRNGRPVSLRVRIRLCEFEGLPAAALGLALQRIVQLTYRPTPLSILLAQLLLAQRNSSGSFGSVSATAVALAALLAMSDQAASLPGGKSNADPARAPLRPAMSAEIQEAIAGALHFLHQAQEDSTPVRPGESASLIGDELDSAIVLWQLGLDPRFARAVRFAELLGTLEDQGLRHDRATRPLLERVVSIKSTNQPREERLHAA